MSQPGKMPSAAARQSPVQRRIVGLQLVVIPRVPVKVPSPMRRRINERPACLYESHSIHKKLMVGCDAFASGRFAVALRLMTSPQTPIGVLVAVCLRIVSPSHLAQRSRRSITISQKCDGGSQLSQSSPRFSKIAPREYLALSQPPAFRLWRRDTLLSERRRLLSRVAHERKERR